MKTIGFPRMLHEPQEVRAFSPRFINSVQGKAVIEKGYGLGMGYKGYLCEQVSRNQCLASDIVVTIRCPLEQDLVLLRPGSVLFCMLHYPTHPVRNTLLKSLGVTCFSMDAVTDDSGRRLVENLRGTARYGVRAAVQAWHAQNPFGGLIHALVMGSGGVGRMAVDELIHATQAPVCVSVVGRSVTGDKGLMKSLLKDTDILVDATYRSDPSQVIVTRDMVRVMPKQAVICDLAVDPDIRAIEDIPIGDLSKTLHCWDRKVVSCYGWPATHPHECMMAYERQLQELLTEVIKGGEFFEDDNNPLRRALARAIQKP